MLKTILSILVATAVFIPSNSQAAWWDIFKKDNKTKAITSNKAQFAASSQEVAIAQCRSQKAVTVAEKQAYVLRKNFYPRDRFNYDIFGLSLKDESIYLTDLFVKLTAARGGFDTECESVLCIAQQTFGKERALTNLYMLAKYKLNFSTLASNDVKRGWGFADLQLFENALSGLPETVFKGSTVYNIYNQFYPGPSDTSHPGLYGGVEPSYKSLTFFPAWFRLKDTHKKEYLIFHEIAHILDLKNGRLSDSKEWLGFSKWEMVGFKEWKAKNKKTLLSRYSEEAPAEDFAEAVAAYRYAPNKLKATSLEKYNFIKEKLFKGYTFESTESCIKDKEIVISKEVIDQNSYNCENSSYGPYKRHPEFIKACFEFYQTKAN